MSENIFLPTSWLKEVKFNIIDNENIWIIIRLIECLVRIPEFKILAFEFLEKKIYTQT